MWGEHRDPGMSMLGVVPREERAAEGRRDGDVFEPPGEAGVVLQGLELRLGEGVVVADLGTAERAGHPEVGEQLRGAPAGHRRAAIRMQGEHLGFDALVEATFERSAERPTTGIATQSASSTSKVNSKSRIGDGCGLARRTTILSPGPDTIAD